MKHILISTLIAAAAMGLSLRAETKPLLNDQELPADTKNALPLADAPAAEDAEAPADEETQDEADALELLLADDALVELDEAAAPDELSTETMMREWIARYAAAARFAGIRAVKGTGGGLSSGGALATAGAELAVPAATPTPSVSVPAAGTVSLADTLTRASAAGVSLGSASASDAGTASVATASSASGTSTILPAAFFSTRSVFSAVPAAAASYSLTGSSGVSAYTADDGTTTEDSGTTIQSTWPYFDVNGNPQAPTTSFTTLPNNTAELNANSIVTFTTGSADTAIADIKTNGHSLQLNASGEKMLGLITGGGAVWVNSGYWQATTTAFSDAGNLYFLGTSQVQFGNAETFTLSNDIFLGKSTISLNNSPGLGGAAIRIGKWDEARTVNFTKTTTILSEGTTIAFQKGGTLNISTLKGSGNLNTSYWTNNADTNKLNILNAVDYTGQITLASAVELDWKADSTFGGLSGNGSVAAGSKLNIANAKDGSSFAGTVGAPGKGVALSLTGTGTQAFKGTSYFSTVSVGAGATLDLSDGKITLANAIENSGTVTVSAATVFNLTESLKNEDAYTLISAGGTISGWELLSGANFTYAGALISGRGITGSAEGVVNYDKSATAKTLTWVGGESGGTWSEVKFGTTDKDITSWQDKKSAADAFYSGDSVTFSGDAAVTVAAGGVTAGTITIAAGTVSLSGGKLSATDGFVVKNGATLKLGRDNADAAKATLEAGAVYAIDSSANTNELSLANVSGAEGSKIAIAASKDSAWGTAYNFTKINALDSGFSGSLGVTAGYLNVSNPNVVNNSNVKNVILEGGNDSGLCFLTSSTTFTKDIVAEGNGGALRSYANNNYEVTFSGTVTGTAIRHCDGGTHTFTNTVNLKSFSADAGVTVFAGETSIGQMNFNGGTVKVTNGTVLDLTNNENNRTGTYGSSSILMIDGEKSTVKISTGTWETGTSLGTAYAQSQLQISNGGTLEVTLAQKNEEKYASKRGFSITGGEGTYRYSGTETSYITHNKDPEQHVGLADGATLIFDVTQDAATLEVTKVIAKTTTTGTDSTTGALKKTGAGTLELKPNGGTNNFTGSVTIAEGKLVAGSENALGTGADTNVVKIAGGQLAIAIADGVTLAQKNVEIALGEAYKTTNGAAVAAISGADKLAAGTTITLSLENEAMNVAAEAAQDSYRIYDGTLAESVTIKLSDSLARLWKLEAVAGQDGVYALVAIPEPSLFGLLAGATALGFSMSSRRRRKKP